MRASKSGQLNFVRKDVLRLVWSLGLTLEEECVGLVLCDEWGAPVRAVRCVADFVVFDQ